MPYELIILPPLKESAWNAQFYGLGPLHSCSPLVHSAHQGRKAMPPNRSLT